MMIAISLSMVGYAYAAWYDMVYIKGHVEMGSLTLAFDYVELPECTEKHWNEDHTQKIPGEYKEKDVGDCDAWFEEEITDEHSGKPGYKKLVIVVDNAYPQYIVHTTFKLHNIGTIPIHIVEYEITGAKYDSTGAQVGVLYWVDPDEDFIGGLFEDRDGDGAPDTEVINLEITNDLQYKQIDPCNTDKQEMDMDFKQEASECHTYKIWVTVWGIQWNKVYEWEGPPTQ
jgi:hypothetical protein